MVPRVSSGLLVDLVWEWWDFIIFVRAGGEHWIGRFPRWVFTEIYQNGWEGGHGDGDLNFVVIYFLHYSDGQ